MSLGFISSVVMESLNINLPDLNVITFLTAILAIFCRIYKKKYKMDQSSDQSGAVSFDWKDPVSSLGTSADQWKSVVAGG